MKRLTIFLALVMMVSTGFSQGSGKGKKTEKRTNYQEQEEWQEEEEKDSVRLIDFGITLGTYFANKYSANYYNGSPLNVNTARWVMKNYYWYQDIKRALDASDTVLINGYPENMHYNVAFYGGLFVRMNLDRKNGIFLEANYAMLKAEDYLTFEVDPPLYLTEPDIRFIPVIGNEGRVLINLGYQRSFPLKSKISLNLQAGGTMSYTQVIKSYFVVGSTQYSMINIYGDLGYVPGGNSQTFNVYQNAFGFGGFLGAGAGIPLTEVFSLEPYFQAQLYPTNLKGYTEIKPSFTASLRILIYFGPTSDQD